MKTVGYVRVSRDKQAERGISLEAQGAKIRAMTLVQSTELSEIIVESGESALNHRLVADAERHSVAAGVVARILKQRETTRHIAYEAFYASCFFLTTSTEQ